MAYFANMDDENVVILPTHRLVRGYAHKPFLELEETLQKYFYVEQHPKTPEGKGSFLKALKTAAKKHRVIGASFKRDPRYLILRLKNKRIMQRLAKDLSAPLRELDVTTLHLLILRTYSRHARRAASQRRNYPLLARRRERCFKLWKKKTFRRHLFSTQRRAEEILAIVSTAARKCRRNRPIFIPNCFPD